MSSNKEISTGSFYLNDIHIIPDKNLFQFQDESIQVQPKLMEVLTYLCRKQGKVVHSDELVENCWPNQFISDSPVHKCIAQLRKALRDASKGSEIIKTIPRKGYVVVARVQGLDTYEDVPEVTWLNGSPYPGEFPYSEDFSAVFYGRDQVLNGLKQLLSEKGVANARWMNLYGSKGSGKTSLIDAGLKPYIKQRMIGEGNPYQCCVTINLMATGSQTLLEQFSLPLIEKGILSLEPQGDDQHKLRVVDSNDRPSSVLIIDNLELLFQSDAKDDDKQSCQDILNELQAKTASLIISAIQQKHLAKLIATISDHDKVFHYAIPEFTHSEIKDIIQKPIKAAGLQFEYDENTRQQLDDHILESLLTQPAPITFIQYLMSKLVKSRQQNKLLFSSYWSLGGLEGCVSDAAEVSVFSLANNRDLYFSDCMYNFVSLNAAGDAAAPSSPVSIKVIKKEHMALVEKLVDACVFHELTDTDKDETYFQLAYTPLLDHWPRLSDWVEENISKLYIKHDLKVGTERWLYHKKDNDLLMTSKSSLNQVRDISDNSHFSLTNDELEYIDQSKKRLSFANKIKFYATSVFTLSFIALVVLAFGLQKTSHELASSKANAENLISFILHDLKDKLEPLGKLELLDIVGDRTITYFESAGTDNLTGNSLVLWVKAVNILGEGHIRRHNYEKAESYLQQSKQSLEAELKQLPDNINLLEQWMLTNYWLGYIEMIQQEYENVTVFWRVYLDVAQKLVALEPSNSKWRLEEAYALNNLGVISERTYQLDQALHYFRSSESISRSLLADDPEDYSLRSDLGQIISWQGSIYEKKGQLKQATELYLESLRLAEENYQRQPENYEFMYFYSSTLHHVSDKYYSSGEVLLADKYIKQATRLLNILVSNDTENFEYKRLLILSYTLKAQIARQQKKFDVGFIYLNNSLDLISAFKSALKYDEKVRILDVIVHRERARLMDDAGQKDSALRTINESIALSKSLNKTQTYSSVMANSLLAKAEILENQQREIAPSLRSKLLQYALLLESGLDMEALNYEELAIYLAVLKKINEAPENEELVTRYFVSDYNIPDYSIRSNPN